jgi:ADP-ribose pyrophosphatase
MNTPDSPTPWPLLHSRAGDDHLVFRVRWDTVRNPRTGVPLERLVCETPEWVNVVALTDDHRLVMIRQWRFGTQAVTLEIPGGLVDPGEDPFDAARRELREESGFTSKDWVPLGSVEPNPAYQTNRCHHFLARSASRTHPLDLDPGEDITVETVPLDDVPRLIHDGTITHALVITALCRILDLRSHPRTAAGPD